MSKSVNHEAIAKGLCAFASLDDINKRLAAKGIPPMPELEAASLALVRAEGLRDQGGVTVLAVNLANAKITGADVTALLAAGFPSAKIGARHGPHYLSLARTGKLEGVENRAIAHKSRSGKLTDGASRVNLPALPGVPAIAKAAVPDLPEPSEEELARFEAEEAKNATEALKAAELESTVVIEHPEQSTDAGTTGSEPVVLDPRQALSALDRASLVVKAKSLGVKASGKDADIIERILAAGV